MLTQQEKWVFKSKLLLALLALCLPPQILAQTPADLQNFNAAYLEYGNTRESNPELAREAARRAYDIGKRVFGESNERTAMLAINYALLIEDETQTQFFLDEAVSIYQSLFGFGSEAMIEPLMRLGRSLSDGQRLRSAAEYYERALRLATTHQQESAGRGAAIELELGAIALRSGQLDLAYSRLSNAVELLQSLSDAASQSNHARANLLLGDYFLKTEQYRQAVQPLLVALESLSKYPNADVTLRNRIALIVAYENLGMQEAATVHCLAIGATGRVPAGQNMRPLYSVIPTAELADGSSTHTVAVRVAFTVDENGFVRDAELVSGSSSETLSTVFLNAIGKFRFAPQFVDGEAVATPNQQFVFRY